MSGRTLARSALLAASALVTVGLPPLRPPQPGPAAILPLGIFAAELALIAVLSPEVGEGLVRLGYSEPCELRILPAERTLAALRRSSQWRRHAALITSAEPVDMWRELCWRYVVFAGEADGRPVELVFAVFLRQHRPAIQAARCVAPRWTGAACWHGRTRRCSPPRLTRASGYLRCPAARSAIFRFLADSRAGRRQPKIVAGAALPGMPGQAGCARRKRPKCGTVNAIRPRSEL